MKKDRKALYTLAAIQGVGVLVSAAAARYLAEHITTQKLLAQQLERQTETGRIAVDSVARAVIETPPPQVFINSEPTPETDRLAQEHRRKVAAQQSDGQSPAQHPIP